MAPKKTPTPKIAPAPPSAPSPGATGKPPIYLLDSMAFIFRAYHAMQRQRPMSTRTGIPTAATYVFVNMINKLRKDFSPQYLAAVYDVGAPVHRNEQAKQLKDVQKFNIKTQQFETIEYGGYKANRVETPPDLIQQQPYIRRALEAFRIPILYYEGFEADDVIGTLSCQLSSLGHKVFVVSSDKDMMQLVNADVSILNPTKDNLILDAAGVEAALGVPPERVIDVMALRGDSIDNIPGAPGIGDKGSVELIQQFGTVEAALDRADEVKKKTYRESLQNNRDNILLSKELVTIHTSVPIEFSIEDMRTQPVDNAACRALFSELEFTTLLKELAPATDNTVITFNTRPTDLEIEALLAEAREPQPRHLRSRRGVSYFRRGDLAGAAPRPVSGHRRDRAGHRRRDLRRARRRRQKSLNPRPRSPRPCPSSARPHPRPRLSARQPPKTPHASLVSPPTPPSASRSRSTIRPSARPFRTQASPSTCTISRPSPAPSPPMASPSPVPSRTSCCTAISPTLPTAPTPSPTSPRAPPRALSPTRPETLLAEAATAINRVIPILRQQIADSAPVAHNIPKDDPALGGAVTREMLFAEPGALQPTRVPHPLRRLQRGVCPEASGSIKPTLSSTSTTPSISPSSPSSSAWRRPASASIPPSSARCPPVLPSTWIPSQKRSTRAPATASISTPPSSSATSSSTR